METRFAVLLFTDIVGSTDLKGRYGVPAYGEALRTHNTHFERLAHEGRNITILKNIGDGYFAEAGSIAEAVRFALLFQAAMRDGPWSRLRLTTRVGIHAGEVGIMNSEMGSDIVGPAADLAARVMGLALGGQILLTRLPFDEARHFIREHPASGGKPLPPLRWLAHGPYQMKGCDEPIDIFEIGAERLAPLVAPPDGTKARRAIRPGDEETLGWRPAVGLEIPGRPDWHLTELLGAGGFGEVWAGEHTKLHQRRAFKFCFDNERLRALKREVTLVRLLGSALGERDDIVRIHELKLDAPPFYLESDLAPHGNLLQWAASQGGLATIPLDRRIALVAHTATALAAAHSIGVLHKDIKPTNILIFDGPAGEPRPRLVDFGIGTLAEPAVLGQYGLTAAGFTLATINHSTGTPTYSPPEYLAGRPYTIQGDIYGLGVLLYQLVTGKPLDPLAPGWERDISDPLLREDIAVCVDGDPARRLPSAADLAERLLHLEQRRAEIEEQELLAREAAARVEAEAAVATARLRAARFRKLSSAFAVLALLAVTGGVLAWMNQRKATTALGKVREQTVKVEEQKAQVESKNTEYRSMLAEAARSDRLVAEEKLQAGHEREAFAHLARACEYDPGSTLAAEKAMAALNTWQHPLPMMVLAGHQMLVASARFSPDGTRMVTASEDKTARVWDSATGKCLATLAGNAERISDADFSPDGTRIITKSKGKTARIWDTSTGVCLATLAGHEDDLTIVRFSPDGTRVVTASKDRSARVWNAADGKCLATLAGHAGQLSCAEFSPDGARIVTASGLDSSTMRPGDKTARLWDAHTGQCLAILAGHEGDLKSVRFSPDGTRMVTAAEDKTARLWDAATGKCLAILAGHEKALINAEFSPDGSRIVTASWDQTIQIWDTATGKSLTTLTGHERGELSAHFSPDGKWIVTVSASSAGEEGDSAARLWDAATGMCLAILAGHQKYITSAKFSPDGTHLVTTSGDMTARVWDTATGKCLAILAGHEKFAPTATFSPDGTRILTTSGDTTARVWDLSERKWFVNLPNERWFSASFSPDGTRVVRPSSNSARVWDASTGRCLTTLAGHEDEVMSAEFSPDGMRIVTASCDKTARVWDGATGRCLITLAGHGMFVTSAQFSPDGSRVVTASDDKTARVWDGATGKCLATLAGHEDRLTRARFGRNGTRVVTASWDRTARLWDSATGECLTTLAGHEKYVASAEFSPDGKWVVTATFCMPTRVWDASTGKSLATLRSPHDIVDDSDMGVDGNWAEFSPDGTRIVTASSADPARVWDAATGECLATLTGQDGWIWSARFSPDGNRIVTTSKSVEVWDALLGKRLATLSRSEDGAGSMMQFSPDGTRIVTSSVRSAKIWNILPPAAGPPPQWFADFLRYVAQMRFNTDGELETLSADAWLALRERLHGIRRASPNQDTPYLRVLCRFVPE